MNCVPLHLHLKLVMCCTCKPVEQTLLSCMLGHLQVTENTMLLTCMQDLAPVVLYSRWDQGISQAQLPSGQSPWQHALPGTAQEDLSGLNGFRSPSMCKEVYQFEAQGTTAVQATQHVQRFLTGGSSMRGSGSIALPPVPPVQVCI